MIGTIAMLAALLVAAPQQSGSELSPTEAGAELLQMNHDDGHGDRMDFMHHIADAREIETPFGVVHLPEQGSWMLGPVDITPTKHVVFLWLAAVLVILTLTWGGRRAKAHHQEGKQMGRRYNVIEAFVLFLRDQVVMPNVGHGGERYVPFVITMFFFILITNLLGLIPWGSTATANISVTAGLAILSFCMIEYAGARELGVSGYVGTIFHRPAGMGPVGGWFIALLLAPVEFAGKLTKPFALAVRLMANMTAGHLVMLALLSLIFVFGSWFLAALPVLMSVAIFFLEIFVGFLQAYIFTILTAVFIGLIRHSH